MIKDIKIEDERSLYLLSFIDVIDRIDIFILEIRHLQQSIIYSLHSPSLYLPLRFEEEFILEANWNDSLWKKNDSVWDANIASRNVIRYPSPKVAVSKYDKWANNEKAYLSEPYTDAVEEMSTSSTLDAAKAKEKIENFIMIKRRLQLRIGQIWMGDDWSKSQRRQYYILRTLQILKQQIIRLKFTLARAAIKANLIGEEGATKQLDPAAFVILRRGIIISLRRYVNVFNNHRQQVAQSLESGLPHDPSPSLERRREIGLFADYMSSSGEQIHHDMLNLLRYFRLPPNSLHDERSLVFHSLSHAHTVDNFHLYDDVYLLQKERHLLQEYGLEGGQNVSYINSSFWLPDRPDLYPIVAREVAVSIVREQLKGLDDVVFSTYDDEFTDLLLVFKNILFNWSRKNPELCFIKTKIPFMLQAFAADLLAATVKGVSYLYALFLLHLGDNLEHQLYVNASVHGKMSFDMAYLLENGTAPFEEDMLWYFQFNIVATWIEKTAHIAPSEIDYKVINGVRKISDDVLDFLDKHTPPKRRYSAKLLINIKQDLVSALCKHPVVRLAKGWRKQRSDDYWHEAKNKHGKGCFPRTSQRLDTRLQNYLYRLLLKQKTGTDRLLVDDHGDPLEDEALEKGFEELYILDVKEHKIPKVKQSFYHPDVLFRHVYDIPFQCSVMRSIDLIHKKTSSWENSWEYIWGQMHKDMAQGRDLFAIALEFHMREVESPRERLMQCINLVTHILREFKEEAGQNQKEQWDEARLVVAEQLVPWLNSPWLKTKKESKESKKEKLIIKKLSKEDSVFNNSFTKIRDNCSNRKGVLEISATALSAGYFGAESSKALFVRRLEFLSKCKLKELFDYIDSYCKILEKGEEGYEEILRQKKKYCKAMKEEKNAVNKRVLEQKYRTVVKKENEKKSELKQKLISYKYAVELRHVVVLQNSDFSRENHNKKDEFYRTMLQAFGDRWECYEDKKKSRYPRLPRNLKTSLLSRLVMTNVYPILNPKNITQNPYESDYSQPLDKVLSKPVWLNKNQKTHKNEIGYTMLGRYDAIVIRETKWPCRCRIQRVPEEEEEEKNRQEVDVKIEVAIKMKAGVEVAIKMDLEGEIVVEKKKDIERFIPYFSRRETALHMDLKPLASTSGFNKQEVFAIIVVSLQRRPMRLDFLFRLLQDKKESYLSPFAAEVEQCLAIRPDDVQIRAYLTDGWGDIVLFFSQTKKSMSVKSINWIHKFQPVLFTDVMVDRTETLFSPLCLDYVIADPCYQVMVQVRLLEDRWLSYNAEYFRTFLTKVLPKAFGDKIKVSVFSIPGRKDYHILFHYQDKLEGTNSPNSMLIPNFHQTMINCFAAPIEEGRASIMQLIDRIETIIEQNIEEIEE